MLRVGGFRPGGAGTVCRAARDEMYESPRLTQGTCKRSALNPRWAQELVHKGRDSTTRSMPYGSLRSPRGIGAAAGAEFLEAPAIHRAHLSSLYPSRESHGGWSEISRRAIYGSCHGHMVHHDHGMVRGARSKRCGVSSNYLRCWNRIARGVVLLALGSGRRSDGRLLCGARCVSRRGGGVSRVRLGVRGLSGGQHQKG